MDDEVVVLLVSDLLLASRARAAVEARGVACRWVRRPDRLADVPGGAKVLAVDCHVEGALEAASAYICRSPRTRLVGFVSHTDGQTIARARAAGVQRVMARSAFFERPESWLGATD